MEENKAITIALDVASGAWGGPGVASLPAIAALSCGWGMGLARSDRPKLLILTGFADKSTVKVPTPGR